MTYCAGIKINSGIVALSDTCITSGSAKSQARKVHTYSDTATSIFIMSSGLRSVRDKAITYFDEMIRSPETKLTKMYQVANAFGETLKQVAREDKKNLEASQYKFDSHALLGGQMRNDALHELYLIFPEGNWVKVGDANSCISVIGNGAFGRALLNKCISAESSLDYAHKVAILSFDQTVSNTNNVDYPLDLIIYQKDSYSLQHTRIERDTFRDLIDEFDDKLRVAVGNLQIPAITPTQQ